MNSSLPPLSVSFNDELTTTIYEDVEFPSWGKWQIYAEGRLNRYRNNTSYRIAYLELRTRVTHTFAPLRSLSWSLATDHQNIHAIRGYPPIETDPITLPQPATGVLDSVVIDARGDHLLYLRWTGTTTPYGYTRRTLLYSGEQLIEVTSAAVIFYTYETFLKPSHAIPAARLAGPPLGLLGYGNIRVVRRIDAGRIYSAESESDETIHTPLSIC